MPTQRLVYRPGVDVEGTETAGRGGWSRSNLVRWRSGYAEALLGWLSVCQSLLVGVCRALHFWVDLASNRRFAIGTNERLYLCSTVSADLDGHTRGLLYDITPTSGFTPGLVSSGSTEFSLLVWSLDNFGQNLIATPSKQGIFQWVPPNMATRATLITQAPPYNQGAFVVMPVQIVMAFGSSPTAGTLDPLLIRWCSQSDYTDWTPSTTNQAGSFRLSRGNRVVGALQISGMSLLWTDVDLWSVQYIGFPLVFSFFQAGSMCGLISQKSAVVLGNVVYWMSDHGFFRLTGSGAEQIPCSVWDAVFKNLDHENADKCVAGADYHYSEVWFFYPSLNGATGEIDSYVKFNFVENSWDYGPATSGVPNLMARTAWTDQNQPGPPVSVDLSRKLQQQDIGLTADGAPLAPNVVIRSGFQDFADGREFMTVDQLIPDFQWDGEDPSLSVTLHFRNWPGDVTTTLGPFTITPTTEYVTLRRPVIINVDGTSFTAYPAVRAREVAIEITGISGWWRFGVPRLRGSIAGRV